MEAPRAERRCDSGRRTRRASTVSVDISPPSRFSIRAEITGVPPALCAPTRTRSRSVRRNSRSMTGTARASAESVCHSGNVRAAKDLGRAHRQSQAHARHDELPRFAIEHLARRVLDGDLELHGPGGTSNSTRPGAASARSRDSRDPSSRRPRAAKRSQALRAARPGRGGIGFHTNVIFVFPLVPGDMPSQVRIRLRRCCARPPASPALR